jgi:hypothetical protein
VYELILLACAFVDGSTTKMTCQSYKAITESCVTTLDEIKSANPDRWIKGIECRRLPESET